ncbi:MAG: phosphoserine aminotransferase, partial [Alphaproteobacteria bacterium]
ATSAAFAQKLDFAKLDVVTFSWQKVLGGEGQHGILILGPRAVERLESYTPPWPLPKIFRMTKGGKLNEGIFKGETINTPSMLCVEDALDAMKWARSVGGLDGLVRRSESNLEAIAGWVARSDWAAFLAEKPRERSCTSICLKIDDPWFNGLDEQTQTAVPKAMAALLESENVAYDINGYRDAPAGLRIWGGATVETSDIEALLPWLDWAYARVKADQSA